MRRFKYSSLLALVALLVLSVTAQAGVSWCRSDPIVRLNGTEVQMWVAIPEEFVPLVNGPIDVVVKTPSSVTREVVLLDPGFNGYGEVVTFADRKGGTKNNEFDMTVEVRVPVNVAGLAVGTLIPVQVEVIPANAPTQYFSGTHSLTSFTMKVKGTN